MIFTIRTCGTFHCDLIEMYMTRFLIMIVFVSTLTLTFTDEHQNQISDIFVNDGSSAEYFPKFGSRPIGSLIRNRRDNAKINQDFSEADEVSWTTINEEVDMVIPMVLQHFQKLGIEHLQLPDMKESISVKPLFITYNAGLFLTNGIVYNLAGIQRHSNAYMTYEPKSFLTKFYLKISTLQFEYDFLIKLMGIEGSGRVLGSLDDTIVYAELAVNVINAKLHLKDFRIIEFRNIHVQLDQSRLIRQLTGLILSPITNLFKDRITTSIADGLKEQMQYLMDDFNNEDPLELRKFTKQLLSGLTGDTSASSN